MELECRVTYEVSRFFFRKWAGISLSSGYKRTSALRSSSIPTNKEEGLLTDKGGR